MKDESNKIFWERFSSVYGRFMEKNDSSYDEICNIIKPYLNMNQRVLELACGTGQFTYRLCNLVKSWTATDFSPKMVDEAAKNDYSDCLRFCVADATNLSYDGDIFDAVLIANALHIMPDPDSAMREIKRVLKPGGMLFAPTFVYDKGYSKIKIFALEKAGFRTFHKWTSDEFGNYIAGFGFEAISADVIKGSPLKECILIAKLKDEKETAE